MHIKIVAQRGGPKDLSSCAAVIYLHYFSSIPLAEAIFHINFDCWPLRGQATKQATKCFAKLMSAFLCVWQKNGSEKQTDRQAEASRMFARGRTLGVPAK